MTKSAEVKPSFWKSPAGIAAGVGIGIVGLGFVSAMAKNAQAAPALPPSGVRQGPTTAAGQITFEGMQPGYYLFDILSNADPTSALSTAGFGQIQAQRDPYQASNWLVSAYWTAPSGATTVIDGGPGVWSFNVSAGAPTFLGTTAPPVPQPYSGLVSGNWYTFSVRTSFLQGAPQAIKVVSAAMIAAGFTAPMIAAAADTSSSPDTWNVAAQWGTNGSSGTQDAPPLWVFVTQPSDVGTTQPPVPSSATP